jgi:hypothetical protein
LSLLVHGTTFHSFADHAKHNGKQDTRDPHPEDKDPQPTNLFQKHREGRDALGLNVPGFAMVQTRGGTDDKRMIVASGADGAARRRQYPLMVQKK